MGYGRRLGLYVLASLILLGDVARHTWDFFQTDRAQGRLTWGGGVRSAAEFVLRQGMGLARMAVGWLGYGLPLHRLVPAPHAGRNAEKTRIEVRPLQAHDIPRLLVLEHRKWSDDQAASVLGVVMAGTRFDDNFAQRIGTAEEQRRFCEA